MTTSISIYPGTFDPLTFGHIDIIERAARLGNQLIVAVAENSGKQPLFSVDERTEIVLNEVQRINKTHNLSLPVLVKNFSGLLTDFADSQGAHVVIRGLRAVADFEYEFQMASINKRLHGELESVFNGGRTTTFCGVTFCQRSGARWRCNQLCARKRCQKIGVN